MPEPIQVGLTVNGRRYSRVVEPRLLLSDFLRHELGLTGTHVGCEHGVCGACTVLVDGQPARACLMLAVQADGAEILTVEGLAALAPGPDGPDALHPIQEAFWEAHGLQCGFCTPGFLITTLALLRDTPRPSEEQVRAALSGNLCRCTGYQNIVNAVLLAAERLATATGTGMGTATPTAGTTTAESTTGAATTTGTAAADTTTATPTPTTATQRAASEDPPEAPVGENPNA